MPDDPHRDRLFEAPERRLEHHRSRLWLSHGVTLAVLIVAVLNPVSLERWAAANPPSWAVETVRLTVGVWSERMQLAGLDTPRNWVSARWTEIKHMSWDDVRPAASPEADASQQPPAPEETS